MNTTTKPVASERLALCAGEVATLLGISERHVWGLNSSGRIPKPIRLGKSVRWRVAELNAWLSAGAPPRDKWEILRKDVSDGHG